MLDVLRFVCRWNCRCAFLYRVGVTGDGQAGVHLCPQIFKALGLPHQLTLDAQVLEQGWWSFRDIKLQAVFSECLESDWLSTGVGTTHGFSTGSSTRASRYVVSKDKEADGRENAALWDPLCVESMYWMEAPVVFLHLKSLVIIYFSHFAIVHLFHVGVFSFTIWNNWVTVVCSMDPLRQEKQIKVYFRFKVSQAFSRGLIRPRVPNAKTDPLSDATKPQRNSNGWI